MKKMLVESIRSPRDLKKLNNIELMVLADEIRACLIKRNSEVAGHLASNLGIVELTIALHYVFESPSDKIIFDVSHQSYVHKILTGRMNAFIDSNHFQDVTGFTNPDESDHDMFALGHTSSSISLACGMVKARDLIGGTENIIAVIGDSALDGGQAFEGLNYARELNSGLIIIVNDNNMSVPENYGGLHHHLNALSKAKGELPDNFFKSLGFEYHYIENGNSIEDIVGVLRKIKGTEHVVVVHCRTKKGKGYIYAENDPENWHWAVPFDIKTGEKKSSVHRENYGDLIGDYILKRMEEDSRISLITASTPVCVGFNKARRLKAGKQFVDVGIAEQNAITIATGMAKLGCIPIVATNSTFFQRGYDQIEQEMCLNGLPVTLLITHASIYGHSTDTHAGLYDIALLSNIPNLVFLAPSNLEDYIDMLDWSISARQCPVAIRVPWTGVRHSEKHDRISYDNVRYHVIRRGSKIAILALGGFFSLGEEVYRLLKDKYDISATLIDPVIVSSIDEQTLNELKSDHIIVLTIEDAIVCGGFGAKIAQYYSDQTIRVVTKGFAPKLPRRFDSADIISRDRMKPEQIAEDVVEVLGRLNETNRY